MSPPKKKRKTPKTKKSSSLKPSLTQVSASISSLPNDLLLSCFARVSRLHYRTLSLVSKRFRSLIGSPELYKTRSFLGQRSTESCLYVCLHFFPNPNLCWFTLSKKPNQTLTDNMKKIKKKERSSGYVLVPIPSPNSPQSRRAFVVAIGSSIYAIGGFMDNKGPSASVSVLDCRSHTWHQAPNMKAPRRYPAANVIDDKIYVVGGYISRDYNSSNWIEVFDPKTQIWNSVSSAPREICDTEIIYSIEMDRKICMYVGGKVLAYNPKDGTIEPIEWHMGREWVYYSHCVVENVLLCYYHAQVFKWFDTKARLWRDLKGLGGIMGRIARKSSVKLAVYGGKMVVLWDRDVRSSECENKVIWCAVISIERRNSGRRYSEDEIWGMVEWFDVVLTVPMSCRFVHVLAATL